MVPLPDGWSAFFEDAAVCVLQFLPAPADHPLTCKDEDECLAVCLRTEGAACGELVIVPAFELRFSKDAPSPVRSPLPEPENGLPA